MLQIFPTEYWAAKIYGTVRKNLCLLLLLPVLVGCEKTGEITVEKPDDKLTAVTAKTCDLDISPETIPYKNGLEIAYISKAGVVSPSLLQEENLVPTWEFLNEYISYSYTESQELPETNFVYLVEFCQQGIQNCLNYKDSYYCYEEDGNLRTPSRWLDAPMDCRLWGHDMPSSGQFYDGLISLKLPNQKSTENLRQYQEKVMSNGWDNVSGKIYRDIANNHIMGAVCFISADSENWVRARRISECVFPALGFSGNRGELNTGIFSEFEAHLTASKFLPFSEDKGLIDCLLKFKKTK